MTKASTRHTADLIRVTLFGQQDFFRPKCYSNVNKKTKIVETTSHKSLSQLLQQPRQALQVDTNILIVLFHQPIILQIATTSNTTTSISMEALSINATVTASNFGSFAGSDAAQGDALVDRSTTGYYNSGNFAPQYVQLQLSGTYTVCEVYLNVVQTPNGVTQNQLSVGLTVASLQLVTTMNGYTSNGQWLNTSYNPCLTGVTFLRLTTTSSPSWPAWAKFLVYGY
ncbi:unnamed protein product [Rotaria socialis]|uniref:Uncharacterized protein n=1 Tax=Rotaria socialis TaxID=392032 RepID=A0A817VS95_9BILA|nr:unnamed protein product [Rotaria socialis]